MDSRKIANKAISLPAPLLCCICLSACVNTYVADLLRGPSELEGLSIEAYDQGGARLLVGVTALDPLFNKNTRNYTVTVPEDAFRVTVKAAGAGGAEITYSAGGADNTTGEFSFPPEENSLPVTLSVALKFMETTVYTLTIYRRQPAWVKGITVNYRTEGGVTGKGNFAPAVSSSITDYIVAVPVNASTLTVGAQKRSGTENISITLDGNDIAGGNTHDVTFPLDSKEKELKITAAYAEEYPYTIEYTLTVRRLFKVSIEQVPDINFVEESYVISDITGQMYGEARYYREGEIVQFKVRTPVGTKRAALIHAKTAGGKTLSPTLRETADKWETYQFAMPAEDAEIGGGGWVVIPGESNVRYVYESGGEYDPDGKWDGKSWQTATCNLQAVINDFDKVTNNFEIWVAGGTYYPVYISGVNTLANPASYAFIPKPGVKVYGGFAGTEISLEDRNTEAIGTYNKTVLSGYNEQKREYYGRVMTISSGHGNTPGGMEFDGLTFAYGSAERGGGVMVNNITGCPIAFRNCTFRDNFSSLTWGAAIAVTNSAVLFERCDIINNFTYMDWYSVSGNNGLHLGSCSVYIYDSGSVTIRDSRITATTSASRDNQTTPQNFQGTLLLEGVEISGNKGTHYSAGKLYGNNITINHCTITGNFSTFAANFVNENLTLRGNITVKSSVIWGNGRGHSEGNSQYALRDGSTITFTNSLVQDAPAGIGENCLDGTDQQADYPRFVDPLEYTFAPSSVGDYRLRIGSPLGNAADGGGNIGAYQGVLQ